MSYQHFEVEKRALGSPERPLRRKATDKERDDKDAKIEVLTNMKLFLQEKVNQTEQKMATNMKDIGILKELLRIEQNSNQKKDQLIKSREAELKETRDNYLEQQSEWLIKKNEMALKMEEQTKQIQNLQIEIKKLKIHKKVLKEEVTNLRQQQNTLEIKSHSKDIAIKNLNDFFKRQTEGLQLEDVEDGTSQMD